MNVNPNYIAYAKSHNMSVAQRKKADEREWSGGKMAGFNLFIGEQGVEFDKEKRDSKTFHQPTNIYDPNRQFYIRDHNEFNVWLRKKFKVKN